MNKDLKPCPKGHPAEVSKCPWSGYFCLDDEFMDLQSAITAWNTRPPSPALKVAREALERIPCCCSVHKQPDCLRCEALALLAKEGV
jgi:hypothetical protein